MRALRRVVVVAAKPPAVGKSRLAVPEVVRRELATAFALDVLGAAEQASGVDEVVLMTTDQELAETYSGTSLADPAPGDLNNSLARAATLVRADVVVALLADLPALRSAELAGALEEAQDQPAYVADAVGTGTTCHVAPMGSFTPRFGQGSAAAHTAAGAAALTGDWPGLRTDVDDLASLQRVLELGVGPHTARVLADHTPLP